METESITNTETDMEIINEQDVTYDENAEEESSQVSKEDPVTKQLIAVYPILFEAHQYKPGDALPTHDLEMNEAWITNQTAVWRVLEDRKVLKANPATAPAGVTAIEITGRGDELQGKVPIRKGRKKG